MEEIKITSNLEMWVPAGNDPVLQTSEKTSLFLQDEIVDELYPVLPAFLQLTSEGWGYTPCDDLPFYYIVATLKKAPYLVLYEEHKKSPKMRKMLNKMGKPFYVDFYFQPNFGIFRPSYMLFEQVELLAAPTSIVLFREL